MLTVLIINSTFILGMALGLGKKSKKSKALIPKRSGNKYIHPYLFSF